MRLQLPLLLVFLACAASQAFNPYVGEQYPYYYNRPSYYKSDDAEDLRQMMFSLALPARQTTVTVTTTVRPTFSFPTLSMPILPPLRQTITSRLTTYSTITCTKSTDVPCPAVVKKTITADLMAGTSGSQKNTTAVADVEVEEEDDAVQQFASVTPTVVQKYFFLNLITYSFSNLIFFKIISKSWDYKSADPKSSQQKSAKPKGPWYRIGIVVLVVSGFLRRLFRKSAPSWHSVRFSHRPVQSRSSAFFQNVSAIT